MKLYTPDEPIAAIATALAPSALGIVRCSGKGSVELVAKLFSRPEALLRAAGNTIVYGWIQSGTRRIDETLVSVFRAPKSFTGEDMAEISCHGGPAVVTAVYNLLIENGFRAAERGEFTFRAYVNGKTDLTRAEAVREIIEARTDVSRGRAAGRLAGSLYAEIDEIKKLLIDTLASIEVDVEYPEDEETIADSFDKADIETAAARLETLAASWKSEKLYQDGARVVLCGKTNAGKSSMFNALLKEDRAIVSGVAGTTRDWLESWADFDGVPVRLFDTAGLRDTADEIERQGVELAETLVRDADVVLYLVDAQAGFADDDADFLSRCEKPLILVWNKCDAVQTTPCLSDAQKNTLRSGTVSFPRHDAGISGDYRGKPDNDKVADGDRVIDEDSVVDNAGIYGEVDASAKNGAGLSDIVALTKSLLVSQTETERVQAGLGSARQKAAVEDALMSVRHALRNAADFTLDAVVQDLEDALASLGEVTGEVTPDDVLDSVFANFCVGK